MRKILILMLIVPLISTCFYSCNKYEDGPFVSFRSKMSRITGTWISDDLMFNMDEEDENNGIGGFQIDFTAEKTIVDDYTGDYSVFLSFMGTKIQAFTADFQWEFKNDDEYIKISVEPNSVKFNSDFIGEEEEMEEEIDTQAIAELLSGEYRILRLTKSEFWIEFTYEDEDGESVEKVEYTKKD